eukprot:1009901_1
MFSDPMHLPFEILEDEGNIFVHHVSPEQRQSKSSDPNQRLLTPGLRIVAIDGQSVENKKMNFAEFDKMMNSKENAVSVTITFREEIESQNDTHQHPLGVGYRDCKPRQSISSTHETQSHGIIERRSSNGSDNRDIFNISFSNQPMSRIENEDIVASSFQEC